MMCVQQLGELQASAADLQAQADVYTINRDSPVESTQVRQVSGTTLPILYDKDLAVARQYDFLPKPDQPMGGMSGIPQMGFVIIDAQGIIRVQRVDLLFGEHAGQILEILEAMSEE